MTLLADEERLLPPEYGFNFRDFGGYPTTDGGRVKTGMLFRSGLMAHVGDDGRGKLTALGIASICDLRSSGERDKRPTRWHEGLDVEFWARDYGFTFADLDRAVLQSEGDADAMHALMLRLYDNIAYEHAASYRGLFGLLTAGKAPLLVNCSAGKDRTGSAVALVLSALGVGRATIIADYLLTARADFAFLRAQIPGETGQRLTDDARAPLFAADRGYIDTLFASIERSSGSVEVYCRDELGVGAEELRRIRELLVDH